MRTVPHMHHLFQPLEEAIRHNLIPALTGKIGISDLERNLLELPVRLGGLGIVNPTNTAYTHHNNSLKITAPLTALILLQEISYPYSTKVEQATIKYTLKSERQKKQTAEAAKLRVELTPSLQRTISKKGASSWLMTLPIHEHNFALPKGSF